MREKEELFIRSRRLRLFAGFLVLVFSLALLPALCPQDALAKTKKNKSTAAKTVKSGKKSKNTRKSKSAEDLKITAVKKKGKLINWHAYLPDKYRDAYHVMQGAATDGKYNYMIFWKRNKTKCIIMKVKAKNSKPVMISAPLKLYHGNDLVYNPSAKLLYSVYSDQQPFLVTAVDPGTLTIRSTMTVRIPSSLKGASSAQKKALKGLVAITYNEKKKQYAMRVSGKNDFLILDAAFQPLKYVTVTNTPKIRCQSMDSDDKYIYICMDRAGSYNLIAVYGWDGTWKKTITVPLILEIESLYHIGKKTYATFYNTYGPSSHTFRLYLPRIE